MLIADYTEFVRAIDYLSKAMPGSRAIFHFRFDGVRLIICRTDQQAAVEATGSWPGDVAFSVASLRAKLRLVKCSGGRIRLKAVGDRLMIGDLVVPCSIRVAHG